MTPEGKLGETKVKLGATNFKEAKNHLDPNKQTTIVIELPL